jgi:hypothetical protein
LLHRTRREEFSFGARKFSARFRDELIIGASIDVTVHELFSGPGNTLAGGSCPVFEPAHMPSPVPFIVCPSQPGHAYRRPACTAPFVAAMRP